MTAYSPLKITGMSTGLVQNRENFLLPDDAYPVLVNAYVWRERLLRKRGYQILGRLQRNLSGQSLGAGIASGVPFNLFSLIGLSDTYQSLVIGSVVITLPGPIIFTDQRNGTLTSPTPGNSGIINYATGDVTLTTTAGGGTSTATLSYYPGLPVMGIRLREIQNSSSTQTVVFDQKYAYVFNEMTQTYQEFIPGTTWNASNATVAGVDFFWSTNYWVSSLAAGFSTTNMKLFWVTNNTGFQGANADPVRITDGTTWINFFPSTWSQIDGTNFLTNFLSMVPYRGRMVTFNTWEGPDAADSLAYPQRIRWSTIGNPFIPYAAGPPSTGSWRDDIRGQGGFLDIPTSENITAVGFVRDNLVIYCERSTWQLRYTGRSISPFQIEKVNSELGAESPYSGVQFDTSLAGVGDKGVVNCDSYKSERFDIKIPDLVFQFQPENNGTMRVHGVRDFINRLAFWTIPVAASYDPAVGPSSQIFPNTRLVYNYENDSWALFTDTLTTLGTYMAQSSRTWVNTNVPWVECNFSWINQPSGDPVIIGGNQQGFIERLDELTVNDVSMFIAAITANTTAPTVITSPNHNMQTGFVIGISGIPTGTPFDNLNGGVFGVVVLDANNFQLFLYDNASGQFSTPQLDVPSGTYIGGGLIKLRENFSIKSKKFNFLDEGQNIQLGFLDILMEATEPNEPGAISLMVYLDYNDSMASNISPMNEIVDYSDQGNSDTFFNSVIPTTPSTLNAVGGSKFWQRVYCATRASFLTIQYTFSNAQLAGEEQTKNVQIDAQVLWIRKGGRMTQG